MELAGHSTSADGQTVPAGYRVEFGVRADDRKQRECYWWTWTADGCGIATSPDEFATAEEAAADARRDHELVASL